MKVEGIGPKTILDLWKKLKVRDLNDLEIRGEGRKDPNTSADLEKNQSKKY